jgi:type IV pilus assembly protein PilE
MNRGFTLIELLICVVIAALLAGIALPSWRGLLMRVHRTDAKAALYALAMAQERYRLVHGHYASQAEPAPPVGLGLAFSARGWYELRVERADAAGFVAAARPAPGSPQRFDVACRLFTIDEKGVRGSVPESPETCWR